MKDAGKKATKKKADKTTKADKRKPSTLGLTLSSSRKLTKQEEAHLKKAFRVFAEGTSLALDIAPIVTTYNSNPGG